MPEKPPTDSGGTPLPDTPSVRYLRVLKLLLTVLLLAVTLYQALTGALL
ncbi:hypothetical protein [Salarchaeum japonicum]|uniref:Uncharacterized protein n=1 Tax=Salarchaeum japonicum TaxID=555573 RepID=A0AAV3SXU1_9EURY|nr:hypothetical protein [Salarchaeum japonicum]